MVLSYRQADFPWHVGAKGDNHIRISFPDDREGVPFTDELVFEVQCEGEEFNFLMPVYQVKMLINRLNEFVAISEMNQNIATAAAKLEQK